MARQDTERRRTRTVPRMDHGKESKSVFAAAFLHSVDLYSLHITAPHEIANVFYAGKRRASLRVSISERERTFVLLVCFFCGLLLMYSYGGK